MTAPLRVKLNNQARMVKNEAQLRNTLEDVSNKIR